MYRHIIDHAKLSLPTRYIAERQLSHFMYCLARQHMFHRPNTIATHTFEHIPAVIDSHLTPSEYQEKVFKQFKDGDIPPPPQPWTIKKRIHTWRKTPKKYCKHCPKGTCRNPHHQSSDSQQNGFSGPNPTSNFNQGPHNNNNFHRR